MPEVLVINGPCGAGKSTVGFECMEILEERGIPAAMVDAELAYFHPQRGMGENVAERSPRSGPSIATRASIGCFSRA
jgi:adenylylsulfate kinase-like enzyme